MIRAKLFTLLVGACSMLLSMGATAAPIEITIPVSLRDMHPDVLRVSVFCWLKDADGRYLRESASSPTIEIVDGAFTGDVVASAEGDPSIATQARSYLCLMQFGIRGAPGTHMPGPVPTTRYEPTPYVAERLQTADGEPFVYWAEGTFDAAP